MTANVLRRDYSLTGLDGKRAVERGLATATWYASPIHRKRLKELPPVYSGFLATYREIVPALMRLAKDPSDHVMRPLPESSQPAAAPIAMAGRIA